MHSLPTNFLKDSTQGNLNPETFVTFESVIHSSTQLGLALLNRQGESQNNYKKKIECTKVFKIAPNQLTFSSPRKFNARIRA